MDDVMGRLRAVHAGRKQSEAAASRERYEAESARRLARVVRRKVTTAFVGALARFEALFGAVWGHGKPAADCTPDQLAWRAVWERARAEVLDNGNHQARAVDNEVAEYTVRWERHAATLPALGRDE